MVCGYVDGVDLNCGCPQGWACNEGLGAGLMMGRNGAEMVREMVMGVKERVGRGFCVSVKMRIHSDLKYVPPYPLSFFFLFLISCFLCLSLFFSFVLG